MTEQENIFLEKGSATFTDTITGKGVLIERGGHNRFYLYVNGVFIKSVPFLKAYQAVMEQSTKSVATA